MKTHTEHEWLTPRRIWAIMVSVCAITPALVMPFVAWGPAGYYVAAYTAYGLIWYYGASPYGHGIGIAVLDPMLTFLMLPVTAPTLVFALGVVRYSERRWNVARLVASAILSVLPGFLMSFPSIILWSTSGFYAYAGPIPIHLIVGTTIAATVSRRPSELWEGTLA
ncbi:MAG: hypothetical protein ACTSVT_10370 [Candidatus Thorarchaeota archaeon]